jgi:hypothetical protein
MERNSPLSYSSGLRDRGQRSVFRGRALLPVGPLSEKIALHRTRMIRLQRPATAPPYFASSEIDRFRSGVRAFFTRSEQARRQERPEFPLFPDAMFSRLMDDLLALSHGKCAYCETPVGFTGSASLDRYRPKAGAVGLDADFSTEHYWWLAYTWENIYPCCVKCNKFKGAKFPVDGPRCRPEATLEELTSETRLLLDPFADHPEQYLDFLDNGMVTPLSSSGDVTIATLELNRSDLVTSRKQVARSVEQQLKDVRLAASAFEKGVSWLRRFVEAGTVGGDQPTSLRRLAGILDVKQPYAAVARAVARRWAAGPLSKASAAAGKHALRSSPVSQTPAMNAVPTAFGTTAKQRTVSRKAQALRSRVVTKIAIHNFRGIRDLELRIDYEKGQGAPWTVLVGENGMGKSSILQAVALALLVSEARAPMATSPRHVLTKGQREGWVRVWLDDSTVPRVLAFTRGSRQFRRSGPEFPGVLLGYGATRLLPRGRIKESRGRVRLENMFDPFRPLIDANRWLGQLDRESFDFVARALKDVLVLPRSARLIRVRRKGAPGVSLRLFGYDLSLEDLSDGYQSVLGLTCDIIAGLRVSSKGALEAAEGLVAIDELGAHLHPRWRMRVVESLRRAFRRVQFVVSTHDPLCLRGLENGEAVVLRRTSHGRIYSVPDLPPIKGLRVDQLLTSEYFGLHSTMDPAIEQKYREQYRLLALRKPTAGQEERLAQLRQELAPFDVPGVTRRERRLLEIIDKELAQTDQEPDRQKRMAIRKGSDQMVADLNRLIAGTRATP